MNIIFVFQSVKYSTIHRQWRSWSSGNSLLFIREVLGSNVCKYIESLIPGGFSVVLPNAKFYFKGAASSHFRII